MKSLAREQKDAMKRLYLHLANDAKAVADRQERYALQAKNERKFAGKDELVARHKKQPSRMSDDEFEYAICMEFYQYRMSVSRHYRRVADHYTKMARKMAK